MKPDLAKALQVMEVILVGVAAMFYLIHYRPIHLINIVIASACIVVSSAPIWAPRFRIDSRYAAVQQSLGFGLLAIAFLMHGRGGVPFAVGLGILVLTSSLRIFRRRGRSG